MRPAWPLLTAAVCGVRTQGYLVRYLWLVLLMSDLLWTMRRTEVNSNERSNEMLLQDVCFCFLFTAWSFFIVLQRRRNLYTCIRITALTVVNVQGFCFLGEWTSFELWLPQHVCFRLVEGSCPPYTCRWLIKFRFVFGIIMQMSAYLIRCPNLHM